MKEFIYDRKLHKPLPVAQGTQRQHVKRLVQKHMYNGLDKNLSNSQNRLSNSHHLSMRQTVSHKVNSIKRV